MKYLFLALCLIYGSKIQAEAISVDINAESAILINADTGAILFEKDANTPRYPASTTKIAATAYILQKFPQKLDDMVAAEQDAIATVTEEAKRRSNYTLPSYWLVTDASHIGIKKGEKMSVRDLLYGVMVSSGDDASNVLAQYLSGNVPAFMTELNRYIKDLGCKNTYFNNPHGLHHPEHKTTAYDLAIMTKAAMKNPLFREMAATVKYPRPKTNKQDSTTLLQTNRLLRKGKFYYAKAIGVKTGYMSTAGYNLVAAAKDGNRTLIAVVLKCKENDDRYKDAIALFEAAFNQPRIRRTLLKAGPQKFQLDLPGAVKPIETWIRNDAFLEYYPAEEPRIKFMLYWTASSPPIFKDQSVGELRIQREDGVLVQTVPLLAQEDIKATWWLSLKQSFLSGKAIGKWIGIVCVALLLIFLLFQLGKRR